MQLHFSAHITALDMIKGVTDLMLLETMLHSLLKFAHLCLYLVCVHFTHFHVLKIYLCEHKGQVIPVSMCLNVLRSFPAHGNFLVR